MDFEKNVPTWEAPGTEPPADLKKSGFSAGYKPPAAFFNWFWHGVSACLTELREKLSGHAADANNPHKVTAAQVGLDKVNNTPDTEKYVKYAQESGKAGQVTNALTVRLNGGRTESSDQFTFDGSTGRTVNITPAKIGAAEVDLSNVAAEDFKAAAEAAGVSGGGGIVTVDAASADGIAYTATVDSVTELQNGQMLAIVPAVDSASTAITLDVNGLGAKPVRVPLSTNTAIMTQPKAAAFFVAGRPVLLQFDSAYLSSGVWKTVEKQRTDASDLYGTVPVESGGTGADNAADARTNLGVYSKAETDAAINNAKMTVDTSLSTGSTNPVQNKVVATALNGKATTATYTATIPTSGWSGSAAPYSVSVTVSGILASDNPIVDLVQSGTESTDSARRDAWGEVTRITTAANSIKVYASAKPSVTIPIQLKVVR